MPVALPELRVGLSQDYLALSVFPLFAAATSPVEYVLSDEALSVGTVEVKEVSEGGSVPDLLVENKGASRVLFLEGEELVGAKQNRVLNTSVLVAAGSRTKIPVSCVERGRWRYRTSCFGSSGSHSPSKLRHVLKSSVSRSAREGRMHLSDQGAVWREVERQQCALGTSSASAAMADTFASHRDRVEEFRQSIQYPEGAVGMAVAVGGRVVALDVFDKPATCQKVWNRLLSGYVLDALESREPTRRVAADEVDHLLHGAGGMAWTQVPPVGEGDEYRAAGDALEASVLTLAGSPVHFSMVAAPAAVD